MTARYLGLQAVGWHVMIKDWWDKLCAGLLLATFVLGLGFVLFSIHRAIGRRQERRRRDPPVPTIVKRYLRDIRQGSSVLFAQRDSVTTSKSFGVFLGSFNNPPSASQARLLSQWDIIVLDPAQKGVLSAVSSHCTSTHVLGRLDVADIAKTAGCSDGDEVLRILGLVISTVVGSFRRTSESPSSFTGILIANWQTHFQVTVINELFQYFVSLGLAVYLELSAPCFLTQDECRRLDLDVVKGLVCRNGTILPDGDRRNFYQMSEMRQALRALAAKSTMRESTVMMWEAIGNDVELEHGVVKRSFNWCRYNSAISWIGPEAALKDADIAVRKAVTGEPLGALGWLKTESAVKLHNTWRTNEQIQSQPHDHQAVYASLQPSIPDLATKLSPLPPSSETQIQRTSISIGRFEIPLHNHQTTTDPFSFSPRGYSYRGLGCFQIGLDCDSKDFADLVQVQRRLRDLDLLQRIKQGELEKVIQQLRSLYEVRHVWGDVPDAVQALEELLDHLAASDGSEKDVLRIYIGLHSGFRTSLDNRFWGLFEAHSDSGTLDIYISAKATDLAGTILHTFLSSRQFSRTQCLVAEILLHHQTQPVTKNEQLPPRLVSDVEQLSPSELILLLQRLKFSDSRECATLTANIKSACEHQLIEVPSLTRLRALNSTAYMQGQISVEELVKSRLAWYHDQGCWHPEVSTAVSLFQEIDDRLPQILMDRETRLLERLESVLHVVLQNKNMDAATDMFCLAVFCAFRKLAMMEVYLEVLDRNPLPNSHPDQAACFAEMFALGSRCEAYFDMSPNVLGRILADRYQAYFKLHQPPMRDDQSTELPTAYSSKQIDLDREAGQEQVPWYYQITFLGIFAVPALIDILLLTTVGRGLYLSSYMSETEKSMATTALMAALFLTGAIGTWIGSGGSYYLHSMAFPAMNMFVVTRWVAGLSISLIGGLVGFIVLAIVKDVYSGVVFFLYLILLTTYLTTLATLAIYQLPGFQFQSGRTTVLCCIPILFISPIVTLWSGNDAAVYLCVLAGFLVALLAGARKVINRWSTWYLAIPCVSDTDIVDWYTKTKVSDVTDLPDGISDLAATPLPRQALLADILRERNRSMWSKPTSDGLVLKLAEGYSATMFLMIWYCKYSRTDMPYRYSPTWNLQCKAAIDTLLSMQKGLKLHNAFVHWREAGDEVYCGVLYFVIALMDKWVALISGASIVGLSDADSSVYRLAVGFGLAYYLMSAIFLDAVAQPLWPLANKLAPEPVDSLQGLQKVAMKNARTRRRLYWSNLTKFFFTHVWGLAITSLLMWLFEASRHATVMYISYVCAYTGLLFYQYNRIFTGILALPDLLTAAVIGLILGPLLHHFVPEFAYSSVIALGTTTWAAALLSIVTAKVGWPKLKKTKGKNESEHISVFYSGSAIGPDHTTAQSILSGIFDAVCALPAESRHRLNPIDHPGAEVMAILMNEKNLQRPEIVHSAFPASEELVHRTVEMCMKGEITIDIAPARELLQQEQNMKSVTRVTKDGLHICVFLGLDLVGGEWIMDIRRNCKVIAEALLQATAEIQFGYSRDHAALAELVIVNHNDQSDLSLPEGAKCCLERSVLERERYLKHSDRVILQNLLFGLNCDTDWDNLPRTTRSFLLRRCLGEDCDITDKELAWVRSTFGKDRALDFEVCLARCNLGVALANVARSHASAMHARGSGRYTLAEPITSYEKYTADPPSILSGDMSSTKFGILVSRPFVGAYRALRIGMKFFVVTIVADPEFQRELDYVLSKQSCVVRWPSVLLLDGLWIFCKALQQILLPLCLIHGRGHVSKLYRSMNGLQTVIEKNRIIVEGVNGLSTCFTKSQADGSVQLHQYSGRYDKEPESRQKLVAINTYTDTLVLRQREEFLNNSSVNLFTYSYPRESHRKGPKVPLSRECVTGSSRGQIFQYDKRGYVMSGSYIKDESLIEFVWKYREHARFDDELLRAEYLFNHLRINVSWSVPSPNHPKNTEKAIPNYNVIEATFSEGSERYHAKWTYDHKSHPVIETTLNGESVETPGMIKHDWFEVLKKPKDCTFMHENPLLLFNSIRPSFFSRVFGTNKRQFAISTSRARAHLWKTWKNGKDLDAVTARWLDEWALRSDRVMRPYWTARDLGRLGTAKAYLDAHTDTVMARVDIDPEISSWTPLAFKTSDLYTFGQGGDTCINTRNVSTQIKDSTRGLHVLAMDTGTWPNEGGGVSACRRDMVNDLKTIKWHIVAECANDYGFPKFQIERNVQSLTVLPLWGLDFLTPSHGVFENTLDSAIQAKSLNTSDSDIRTRFLPILTTLVRCARAINLDHHHLQEGTKALLDLNAYFESSRHWSDIWMSDIVKDQWRELWLTEDMPNTRPVSEWMQAECPTMMHLDQALDMWQRYLFIFSLPIPDKIPDVFQASHHFAGASYGVICKIKRGCTFQVWDHCISWREVTVFLSSAMSFDPPFVCSSLMSLSRILSVLTLHHADVVLPCADFFNPGWEIELGTQEGAIGHRKTYARKIDPVVNGICNMERFKPIEKIKSEKPTAVMLSHVRYVKDIKNAILAADIIVNEWGIGDYRLDIYGDMERAPTYAVECQEIIAAKQLREHVKLRGLGSPFKVLEEAWLFLNSSVSEGLPLAMGEAALTGVPVVCTDVGASFRVVTDPETGKAFSAVVPPNDAYSLARAQVSIMGLLDEWAEFADDEPGTVVPKLSMTPTREEGSMVMARMYAKQEQRRRLGMMGRANVLNSFSADRYLREHEQMLWIGKYRSQAFNSGNASPLSSNRTSHNSSGIWS